MSKLEQCIELFNDTIHMTFADNRRATAPLIAHLAQPEAKVH